MSVEGIKDALMLTRVFEVDPVVMLVVGAFAVVLSIFYFSSTPTNESLDTEVAAVDAPKERKAEDVPPTPTKVSSLKKKEKTPKKREETAREKEESNENDSSNSNVEAVKAVKTESSKSTSSPKRKTVVSADDEVKERHLQRRNLNCLRGLKPSALPYCKGFSSAWREKADAQTALSVFGLFLLRGEKEFRRIAVEDVGMHKQNARRLSNAFELKWSQLALVGSDLADVRKHAQQDGDHSKRWGVFVNAKMNDLTLPDLPGVGDAFQIKWRGREFKTPVHVLGQFIRLGRARFDNFCEEEIGMRKIGNRDNVGELGSAIETKWNSLLLVGESVDFDDEEKPY